MVVGDTPAGRAPRWLDRFVATGRGNVAFQRLHLPAVHRDGRELDVEFTILPTPVADSWRFHAFLRNASIDRLTVDYLTLLQRAATAANSADFPRAPTPWRPVCVAPLPSRCWRGPGSWRSSSCTKRPEAPNVELLDVMETVGTQLGRVFGRKANGLQRLADDREAILAIVGHELRGPLTAAHMTAKTPADPRRRGDEATTTSCWPCSTASAAAGPEGAVFVVTLPAGHDAALAHGTRDRGGLA